ADVRLAEKTARFCTKPDLEARMEDINAELDALTDLEGRPLAVVDESLADGERSAHVVALELEAVEREYAAAMVSVRMRQMDEDDWTAFTERWKKVLNEQPPYPAAFYEDIIVRSAIAPTFTSEQLQLFRKKVGHPAFNVLAQTAWVVNTSSGVSIPK